MGLSGVWAYYLLHGDQDPQTGLYFCRRCDDIAGIDHFSNVTHCSERDRRVIESIVSLRKYSANLPGKKIRPKGAGNLFSDELPEDIRRRLAFDESFLTWLTRSTENPSILDAAQNHPICKASPAYDDILEILEAEDQAELKTLYRKYLTL